MKIRTIIIHERELVYALTKRLGTGSIRINVGIDGSVRVFAPSFVSESYLEKVLVSKADWIFKKLAVGGKIKKIELPAGVSMSRIKKQARRLIEEKIAVINQVYGFSFGRVFIRDQKTRWGSCSSKKNLNFNYKIVFLPEHLLDYIIAHELCHLSEMNHSPGFWHLVARAIPECKTRRKELRGWRS